LTSPKKLRQRILQQEIEEEKLPPLKNSKISQSIDHTDQPKHLKDDQILQTHHKKTLSICGQKIMDLDDETACNLISQNSRGSGLMSSIDKFRKNAELSSNSINQDSPNKSKVDNNGTIYLKRHLLKTRGISSLTRSFNNDTNTVMHLMNRIEKKQFYIENKQLENINLSKIITETSKGFKVALYDL